MRQQICQNCIHAQPVDGQDQLTCTRYPPTCYPVMGQDKFTGQPVHGQMNLRPMVSPDQSCGEFEPQLKDG